MSGPYIQSGNVLFRADPALAEDIPSLISASILSRFGYRVPVVARTARELQEIVQANPFAEAGAEANKLLVLFLAELPDRAHVEALDPNRSPGDETCEERVYAWSPCSAASSLKDSATFSMFRFSPNALAPRERKSWRTLWAKRLSFILLGTADRRSYAQLRRSTDGSAVAPMR